jgi:hypothetical protein
VREHDQWDGGNAKQPFNHEVCNLSSDWYENAKTVDNCTENCYLNGKLMKIDFNN